MGDQRSSTSARLDELQFCMRFRSFAAAAALTLAAIPAAAQTFTKDVAPILQRSCQSCHRPGSVAPMSLISYEDVRPYARAIKQRTQLRDKPGVMPPWYIRSEE